MLVTHRKTLSISLIPILSTTFHVRCDTAYRNVTSKHRSRSMQSRQRACLLQTTTIWSLDNKMRYIAWYTESTVTSRLDDQRRKLAPRGIKEWITGCLAVRSRPTVFARCRICPWSQSTPSSDRTSYALPVGRAAPSRSSSGSGPGIAVARCCWRCCHPRCRCRCRARDSGRRCRFLACRSRCCHRCCCWPRSSSVLRCCCRCAPCRWSRWISAYSKKQREEHDVKTSAETWVYVYRDNMEIARLIWRTKTPR